MKLLLTNFILFCLLGQLQAQYSVHSTTATTLASRLPGFSQVSIYNTKSLSYSPVAPPTDPTPVDEDSTHELSQIFGYADILSTGIVTADGNVTSTTVGKVWSLRIVVSNARSVGLSFSPLQLDPTAALYVFNSQKSELVDSVVKKQFKDTSKVCFPSLSGDTIVVYIVEKGNTGAFRSTVSINRIYAGYQELPKLGQSVQGSPSSSRVSTFSTASVTLNSASVDCDQSVQCQPGKLPQAKAVARFTTNGLQGTGTLINNDANNARCYFLTAFHMIDKNSNGTLDASEISELGYSNFYFKNWRTSCTGATTSYYVFSGATLVTSNKYTDMALLELTQGPGIGDDVTYAGWNRNGPNNSGPYVIHHPQGRDMRIALVSSIHNWTWNSHFWSAHYSSGTVDHGSSGSALFDQTDLIVGQLRSGWSNCNFTDFGDRYGKFGDSYSTLKPYLSNSADLSLLTSLFVSSTTINGPGSIACGSTVQYSIPNFYGCTFIWTPGANLAIASGQGTSKVSISSATASASTSLSVLIRDSKGITRNLTLSKTISLVAGGPSAATITKVIVAPSPSTEITVQFTIPGNSDATSYNFLVDGAIVKSGSLPISSSVRINGGGCGIHNVILQLLNNCGPTNSNTYPYTRACAKNEFVASPNPASNILSIRPALAEEKVQSSASTSVKNTIATVKYMLHSLILYNSSGQAVIQKRISSQSSQYRMDVSNLKAGAYWLTIISDNGTETIKVLIKPH